MKKGKPIPTRSDAEDEAIKKLHIRTGLPNAEIVRRAVRLLALRVRETGSIGFILDDLGQEEYGAKKKREAEKPLPRQKVNYRKRSST